jgi:hypothetical protein
VRSVRVTDRFVAKYRCCITLETVGYQLLSCDRIPSLEVCIIFAVAISVSLSVGAIAVGLVAAPTDWLRATVVAVGGLTCALSQAFAVSRVHRGAGDWCLGCELIATGLSPLECLADDGT